MTGGHRGDAPDRARHLRQRQRRGRQRAPSWGGIGLPFCRRRREPATGWTSCSPCWPAWCVA